MIKIEGLKKEHRCQRIAKKAELLEGCKGRDGYHEPGDEPHYNAREESYAKEAQKPPPILRKLNISAVNDVIPFLLLHREILPLFHRLSNRVIFPRAFCKREKLGKGQGLCPLTS